MVGVVLHFCCIVDVIFVHHVRSAGVQSPSVPVRMYEGGTNTHTFSMQYNSNESDEWIMLMSNYKEDYVISHSPSLSNTIYKRQRVLLGSTG
jgi:hypothetical protein